MCSVISLIGGDTMAVARTMDFNIKFVGNSETVIPKGVSFTMDGTHHVTPRYDIYCTYNYTKGMGFDCIQEAINSEGLSFSLLYNVDNSTTPLGVHQALVWPVLQLANCTKVQEVRDAINAIVKDGTKFRGPDTFNCTIHFYFTDPTGDGLTIEFHNGVPSVYDNKLGVMTNGPEFSWHVTNLRNYLNVSPNGVEKRVFAGMDFTKTGHGNGFLGVPGGNGAPDRFIRLTLNKMYAMDKLTKDNVEGRAAALIGLAHTLEGTQNDQDGKGVDMTLWTVVKTFNKSTKKVTFKVKRGAAMDWKSVNDPWKEPA